MNLARVVEETLSWLDDKAVSGIQRSLKIYLSFYSNETEEIEKRLRIHFPKMMGLEVFYQSVNFIWSISTSYD